ncbi:26S proteasome non-ATPase-like protein regulatory subunit 9 [Lipomyces arxii]|uniref:26S proteasome non-ATPase-like protein regulatory subunit 9 n=1 Tax=Lipomyces arxii TaxID=56418 RepID=UPI0034CEF130
MDIHNRREGRNNSERRGGNDLEGLIQQRRDLESELDALSSVLDSHNVDMNTPLVSADGFPRDDIDVAQVRITRSRVIYLRNDLKVVMNKMATALEEHHASIAIFNGSNRRVHDSEPEPTKVPFAVVNEVMRPSVAFEAGLIKGDKIAKFGDVDASNHRRLSRLASVVSSNEGNPVEVIVLRKMNDAQATAEIHLTLIPTRNGLGCRILPL